MSKKPRRETAGASLYAREITVTTERPTGPLSRLDALALAQVIRGLLQRMAADRNDAGVVADDGHESPAFDEIEVCRIGPAEICAYFIAAVQGRTAWAGRSATLRKPQASSHPRAIRATGRKRRCSTGSSVKCESCQAEKLVAFSCKRRGFCPS